jgi:nucleoside-diphosphate-sugar epimerase
MEALPKNTPDFITDEVQLDSVLTTSSARLREFIPQVSSPLVILGAGGKMGPTLAVLAKHAADLAGHPLEVVAVSRYSNDATRQWLENNGVQTVTADLVDDATWPTLPDSGNVIFLVGQKFGTESNPGLTWALNTLVPAAACKRYANARLVALSTGCVYPHVPTDSGGATESTAPEPVGEYASACLARERLFEFYAQQNSTAITLVRLNYAIDLRYGVLHDIAQKIWRGESVDLSMGHFNCIWQGDANERILRSLGLCHNPPHLINLTSPGTLTVRAVAQQLGELLKRQVKFTGTEAGTAWLSNPTAAVEILGTPETSLETMLRWTAHWTQTEGRSHGKPTHFEVRDGKY